MYIEILFLIYQNDKTKDLTKYPVGKNVIKEAHIHKYWDWKMEETGLSLEKLHMQSPLNQQSFLRNPYKSYTVKIWSDISAWLCILALFSIVEDKSDQLFITLQHWLNNLWLFCTISYYTPMENKWEISLSKSQIISLMCVYVSVCVK